MSIEGYAKDIMDMAQVRFEGIVTSEQGTARLQLYNRCFKEVLNEQPPSVYSHILHRMLMQTVNNTGT
jgi:hypothetical protein